MSSLKQSNHFDPIERFCFCPVPPEQAALARVPKAPPRAASGRRGKPWEGPVQSDGREGTAPLGQQIDNPVARASLCQIRSGQLLTFINWGDCRIGSDDISGQECAPFQAGSFRCIDQSRPPGHGGVLQRAGTRGDEV
jgi:hypothetical protein